MSVTTSGVTTGSYGLLQQLIADSSATSRKLATLTSQSETGYVASTYAGLEATQPGSSDRTLSLAPQLDLLNNTISNLKTASGQIAVQQSAITTISDIASKALSQFATVSNLTPQGLTTAAATARNAVVQIANLLNSQDGNRYIFAGQSSQTQPISTPNAFLTSSFFTSIQTAAGTLSAASVFAAATLPANSPFAASLTANAGAPKVVGTSGMIFTTGIVANTNAFIGPSTGSDTTGSYMKDILANLSAIGGLNASQIQNPGFSTFASAITSSLGNAINTMAQDAGALGNTQSLIATQATNLQTTSNALQNQLAAADQVNMTATLSQLSATQTQLQASYQLIASMKTMTLTQYI